MRRLIRATARRVDGDEAGVTLIELLVSMAILAIVLTAFAGSIIVTLRGITRTEHEVIATQYVAEVSESIQVGDFDFVGLYEDEINPAGNPDAVPWAARLDALGTFEGATLVTFDAPTGDRDDRVATPWVEDSRGGIDIRVDRYITWVDRDGDGIVETRRLTSFATWMDQFGDPRELRFESERVPTQAEAASDVFGRRVIDFRFAPDPVELDGVAGTPTEVVEVTVRTNVPTISGTLQVFEYDSALDVWRKRSVTMSTGEAASSGWVTWTASIPTSLVLSNGQVDFLFTGTEATPEDPSNPTFTGLGTLDTFGGPYDFVVPTPGQDPAEGTTPVPAGPTSDPTVDPGPDVQVLVVGSPTSLCVDSSTWRNTADLVFQVRTVGLDSDDGSVDMTFPYYSAQPLTATGKPDKNEAPNATAELSFDLVTGDESSALWSVTIAEASRVFNPDKYRIVDFDITAQRNGGAYTQDTATTAKSLTTTNGC